MDCLAGQTDFWNILNMVKKFTLNFVDRQCSLIESEKEESRGWSQEGGITSVGQEDEQ